MWKFSGKAQFPHSFGRCPKLYGNCAFPQNSHTRKLGKITVFYAVLGFAVLIFWECLGGLMLYSMKAISWWSSDASVCGWQLRCAEIFWRSSKSWSMMLSLRLISFSRLSTWILLFSHDIVISFSHLFLKVANSFRKHILIFLSVSKIVLSILSNLLKVLEVSSIMLKSDVSPLAVGSVWLTGEVTGRHEQKCVCWVKKYETSSK